jgi:hypothetical protein
MPRHLLVTDLCQDNSLLVHTIQDARDERWSEVMRVQLAELTSRQKCLTLSSGTRIGQKEDKPNICYRLTV